MANVQELYNRFKPGSAASKMVYPLENQSDYLGKITFTPIIETGIEVPNLNLLDIENGIIGKGLTAIEDGYEGLKNFIFGGEDDTTTDDVDESAPGYKQAINDIRSGNGKFYGIGSGQAQVKPSDGAQIAEGNLDLNTDRRIALYLPKAIQIQDTVVYDNAFQLGLIGGAIEAGLQPGGGGAIGAVAGVVAGELAGATNSLLGQTFGGGTPLSKEAGGILAGKIAARAPVIGDAAGGAVRGATRLTTNPNTRALFRDVPIRNFSFTFQLVPTSRAEAKIIEDIIKTFREELYPQALQAGGINVGYKFPNRFLIKVKYNNKDIKGIRFLPVYMQSFNATYNAATAGMHSDGRFTSVDISLAFTETRAIAKADIEGGY